jgi:hypothetical protein
MFTTSTMIFVTAVVFWGLYYATFREAPDKDIMVVLVAFAALCVLGVKGLINRMRKKEENKS